MKLPSFFSSKNINEIKRLIKKTIDTISIKAIHHMVASNGDMGVLWDLSQKLIPDLRQHFSEHVESREVELRIRLLIVFETMFVKRIISDYLQKNKKCSYADIGDSDGSVRLLLGHTKFNNLSTVGINLQPQAVEKMRRRGLAAICADALSIGDQGIKYDIVSVFETLEHVSDPIGFLSKIRKVVNHRLLISVPLIRRSRVNLAYTGNQWPTDKKPTVENTHIFELSSKDWEKIFLHTGWRIDYETRLMMFPSSLIYRIILQTYWRMISFEGFWFVSLLKDDEYVSKYSIE